MSDDAPEDGLTDLDDFRRYRDTRDRRLRNELVERHQGLAYHVAKRYSDRGIELDDLRQVAVIGLVKAVERFDPERGVEFSTYAWTFVAGEIRHHFRDLGWEVHVPRSVKDNAQRVRSTVAELRGSLGREPHVTDVAEATGLSEDEVLEGLDAARTTRTKRFEASPDHGTWLQPDREAGYLDVEQRMVLAELLEDLDDRSRTIVHGRFVEERTQQEIADELGISQVHVSRLLRRIVAELRERAGQA